MAGVVDVNQGAPVVYQGVAVTSQFNVGFNTCPFATCAVNSPTGTPVNVGNPTGPAATYTYSGMTINNQSCKNVQSLGVRIKP